MKPIAVMSTGSKPQAVSSRCRSCWILPVLELMVLLAVSFSLAWIDRLEQACVMSNLIASGHGLDRDAMNLAIERGDAAAVEHLLNRAVDVNAIDTEGLTPLVRAVRCNRLGISRMLLHHGADVNLSSGTTGTPLWIATHQNVAVTQLLLSRGADPNIGANTTSVCPLTTACAIGPPQCVRLLIEAGADVDACGSNGFTPLMAAAMSGRLQVVQMLLDAGADVMAIDDEGKTAMHYASESPTGAERNRIIQLLLDCGLEAGIEPQE